MAIDTDPMFKNEFHIAELITKHFRGKLDAEQEAELNEWLKSSPLNQAHFDELANEKILSSDLRKFNSYHKNAVWAKTSKGLHSSSRPYQQPEIEEKPAKKLWPLFTIAAASIVLLVGITIFLMDRQAGPPATPVSSKKHDIPAGGNKGFIVLANGKTIPLSSTKTSIAIHANQFSYNDGSVISTQDSKGIDNFISVVTPRGGQYQITLPDQSKVWLNAASTLKFPTSFDGMDERNVELSGEAYFEVAKHEGQSFIVKTAHQKIQVLGTHFNVCSYADDEMEKTTLLEGSIKIAAFGTSRILKPGQEGKLAEGKIAITETDTDLAVAWTKNKFMFESEPIVSLMRKVERWYNVEVIYVGDKTEEKFSGNISRFDNISKVIRIIEMTGASHFRIEGRKIYVSK